MANILSLFDGMACGHIAMEQADIPIDSYIAYEIDKYAIQTATHNFPNIVEKGDVFDADFTEYKGQVDYLIGGSPCFTKGHYVLTINGYKDISDIEIGDMVLTHKNRYKPVTRLYKREAPTTQVKITGYDTITTTDNHPFYSVQRSKNSYKEYKKCHSWRKFSEPTWTKVSDMNKDTMCGMHINDARPVDTYYDLDNETMWLLGRYVADGHIRKTKRPERKDSYQYQFIISCGESKIDDFKSAIKNHHYSCFSHSESTYRCVFSSMDLVNFVIDNKFGKSASTKRIPEFIYSMPVEKKKAFLDGYMSGDGCFLKDSNGYSATTVSKELAIGLQRLITQIYKTNVGICKNDNNRPHFIDGREINPNFPLYTVLFKDSIRKQSVAHIKDDIVWTAFKSKHPTGKTETVYNIEVADDNSYTVNNLIVHNCTYWSIAQKNNRETEASGLGWELFSQYVRALREAEPKYFLYENNKSMSKAIRESITETFGFEPICINSALVSAQNRQRLYWAGKREADGTYSKVHIEQPEDRGILLKDILETGCHLSSTDKAYCLTASYDGACAWNTLERSQRSMVAEPCCMRYERDETAKTLRKDYEAGLVSHGFHEHHELHPREDGKSNTVSTVLKDNPICEPVCIAQRGRNPENPSSRITGEYLEQRYEAKTDGKTNVITRVQKDNMVAEPVNTTADGNAHCIKANYYKQGIANFITNPGHDATAVAEPICHNIPRQVCVRKHTCNIDKLKELLRSHKNKTNKEIAETINLPITKVEHWFRTDDCFAVPDAEVWYQLKELLKIDTDEFDAFITEFEIKDNVFEKGNRAYDINGKMSTVMTGNNDDIISPIRVGALPRPNGELSTSQAMRVYSTEGKSVNITAGGGGMGGKTGLYAVPCDEPMLVKEATKKGYTEILPGECVDMTQPNSKTRRGRNMSDKSNCCMTSCQYYQYCAKFIYATPCEWNEDGEPIKAISCADGKTYTVYKVADGQITIKGKTYPIKLVDGFYIIRKLTVRECARLQTIPEWYEFACSDSQSYKQIGNGWTIEVIAHLLRATKE